MGAADHSSSERQSSCMPLESDFLCSFSFPFSFSFCFFCWKMKLHKDLYR